MTDNICALNYERLNRMILNIYLSYFDSGLIINCDVNWTLIQSYRFFKGIYIQKKFKAVHLCYYCFRINYLK